MIKKKRKYKASKIIKILQAYEAGLQLDSLSKKKKISMDVLKSWVNKYTGLNIEQVEQYRELEFSLKKLRKMGFGVELEIDVVSKILEKSAIDQIVSLLLLLNMRFSSQQDENNGFGRSENILSTST